ncbi:MAG: hypothetical protein HQL38_06950 [Alphaproteobacteria bacterium]|nr:hypothetical protein [Alphaproteobacteria bacterium]
MSVANLAIAPDAIRVFTDTMTYRGGTPVRLSESKCHIAASGKFAVAGRGNAWWIDAYEAILDAFATFDAAEAEVCALLGGTVAAVDEVWFDHGHLIELTLAGWSDRTNTLRAVAVRGDRKGVTVDAIPQGIHLRPGHKSLALPSTATDAQMIRAAMVQHQIQHSFDLALCIGGVLHQTTITREGIRQNIAAVYPDYREHAAELGDPNAEAVAAWLAQQRMVA